MYIKVSVNNNISLPVLSMYPPTLILYSLADEIYTLSLANYTGLNSESTTKEIVILGNTEVGVVINDIPVGANFLVVQVHSYIYNVSLTYLGEAKSLLGTNIGFVYTVTALQLPVFYIANDNAANVTFLLAVIGYTANSELKFDCFPDSFSKGNFFVNNNT